MIALPSGFEVIMILEGPEGMFRLDEKEIIAIIGFLLFRCFDSLGYRVDSPMFRHYVLYFIFYSVSVIKNDKKYFM